MAKRINVTTTAYEGDVAFPEADSYPEFVAERLADLYGAEVDCSVGRQTRAFLYGFDQADVNEDELTREIVSLVKVDLWDEFCAEGYKAYTPTT